MHQIYICIDLHCFRLFLGPHNENGLSVPKGANGRTHTQPALIQIKNIGPTLFKADRIRCNGVNWSSLCSVTAGYHILSNEGRYL